MYINNPALISGFQGLIDKRETPQSPIGWRVEGVRVMGI
jgi:hypothetical protein